MQGMKAYLLSVHIQYQDSKENFERFYYTLFEAVKDASKYLADLSMIVRVVLYEIEIGKCISTMYSGDSVEIVGE